MSSQDNHEAEKWKASYSMNSISPKKFRKGKYVYQKGAAPGNINPYDDPTFLSFTIAFLKDEPSHLYNIRPEANLGASPLMNGSAIAYLESFAKDRDRAASLAESMIQLNRVNLAMPWVWQSMTGLDGAYKLNKMLEPYSGGGESKITIECLETYDLMMNGILDMYRHAIYDTQRWVEMVPANLRKFSMIITVGDARFLTSQLDVTDEADRTDGPNKSIRKKKNINHNITGEYVPRFSFHLHGCEIDVDESMADVLGTLNAGEPPSQATAKLVIKYEKIEDIEVRYLQGLSRHNLHRARGRYVDNEFLTGSGPNYVRKEGDVYTYDIQGDPDLSYGKPANERPDYGDQVPGMGQDMMPDAEAEKDMAPGNLGNNVDPNLFRRLKDKVEARAEAAIESFPNSLKEAAEARVEGAQADIIGAGLLGNVHGGFGIGNAMDALSAGGINGALHIADSIGLDVGSIIGSTLGDIFKESSEAAEVKMTMRDRLSAMNIHPSMLRSPGAEPENIHPPGVDSTPDGRLSGNVHPDGVDSTPDGNDLGNVN
jgi:hypothetical protein